MTTYFIATGGTGGHIIPARCIAKSLSITDRVFILSDKKYKNFIKVDDNFRSIIINSSQLKKGFINIIKLMILLFLGIFQSLFYIIKYRPKTIISFGGYATFPILSAAIITRRKIIIHEQNAHLGKVNRIFAKYADIIALTFDNTDGIQKKFANKTFVTGSPVRKEILELNNYPYKLPIHNEEIEDKKMGYENIILASEFDEIDNSINNKNLFNILIIGGSGGAKIFSEILPRAFFNLSEEIKNDLHITQQCRMDLVKETFEEYKNFNLNVEIESFFEDIAEKIKKSHLIIARSGSSSIAEFCIAKKPMILVPFALSADNHQLKNARIVEESGAAIVIEEKDFTINEISKTISKLIKNKEILLKMSQQSSKISKIDAENRLMNIIKNDK